MPSVGKPHDSITAAARTKSALIAKQAGHYAPVLSNSACSNRSVSRLRSQATTEENAEDFMGIHKVEITFHEAGTTKNFDHMPSLFADDATLTSGGKTYKGKDEIKKYWQAAGPFQPQNHWVAYTPAFRIKYSVEADNAHLYFEYLYVDKAKNNIAAHTTRRTF